MIFRLMAVAGCFLALSAFTDENKTQLATACAGSLEKAKEMGRPIPEPLVQNRVAICSCIADGVAKDTTMPDGEKPKITQVFQMSAKGDRKGANDLRRTLDRSVNTVMRKLTRDCSRPHMEAARQQGAKKPAGKTDGDMKKGGDEKKPDAKKE